VKAERPVAATSAEATSLIDDALTARQKEIGHCVLDARTRRNNPHAEVVLEIGIDQEGQLIGVKSSKGAPDVALQECVLSALRDAPFPRSKAGVITVKKNFTDQVFYP
jgi:TonB family protein